MKEWGKVRNGVIIAVVGTTFLFATAFLISSYSLKTGILTTAQTYETPQVATAIVIEGPPPFVVTHKKTPEPLKAIYMTSWVAGRKDLRGELVKFIDESEINALVIDIKDYTGRIAFNVQNPELAEYGSVEKRIPDIKEFIGELHDKHIYVIGRISSFQDSYLVKAHPEWAVKDKTGAVWKDRKGVSWLDAGSRPVWDYITRIGDEAYSVGFDELNFDYIRFPSDGDMGDVVYPYSEGKIKADVLKEFFAHLESYFRPKKIPISADLFGMTTSTKNDLGIGQVLENALVHFDYVSPMVYPSHYPEGFNGWKNPSEHPYEMIVSTVGEGIKRAEAATTTPRKLRPWLQDFSIGHTDYTPQMVRDQIKATYDVGLTSWMIWSASNRYSEGAYLPENATFSTDLQN